MTDWYLEDRSRLNGKPKETIADYVESEGINDLEGEGFPVPGRFASLEEAKKSGREILIRSEHPQEYDGVSGLLDSFNLSEGLSTYRDKDNIYFKPLEMDSMEKIREEYFKFMDSTSHKPSYGIFCDFTGEDPEKFKKETGFSIWEKLGGYKRIVVADSCIARRWHVMTDFHENGKYFENYSIVEEGRKTEQFIHEMTPELEVRLPELIKKYEKIRNLSHFDKNHCPIMEFITNEGKDYFLQYHRCRDFVPVDFSLDREPEEGEKVVYFVRGATPKTGMDVKITVYYGYETGKGYGYDPEIEDGSYDFHYNGIFTELQVRRRKMQAMHIKSAKDLELKLLKVVVGHDSRSELFKPQISIVHNIDEVLNGEDTDEIFDKAKETGKNQYIDLRVISDGRKAYVKRI